MYIVNIRMVVLNLVPMRCGQQSRNRDCPNKRRALGKYLCHDKTDAWITYAWCSDSQSLPKTSGNGIQNDILCEYSRHLLPTIYEIPKSTHPHKNIAIAQNNQFHWHTIRLLCCIAYIDTKFIFITGEHFNDAKLSKFPSECHTTIILTEWMACTI